jgi:2-polyprenyl-3-methyl-5-hydroxy-6-metoxy-1,4-benzoquinol methylase
MCGHKVDGFDYNKVSIDYANNLKKILRLIKINFYLKNLRDLKNLFNIVLCCAALLHLKNPYKVILSLSKNVKSGGYLILSFGLLTSNSQHNLMKFISRFWGDNDNLIFLSN